MTVPAPALASPARKKTAALCERKGWQVAGIYADNDVSAYTRKPRPEWLRLQADIRAGMVTGIACWHVDRLTRSPRELEDVIDLAERNGAEPGTATRAHRLQRDTGVHVHPTPWT
jgi:site-specific DNA recombinase